MLLDAIAQVTGVPARFCGFPEGTRAGQLPGGAAPRRRGDGGPTEGEQFLKVFGKPVRSLSCECERSDDATLNQAFQLITGELMNRGLSEPDNRLGKLLAARKTDGEIVEELYLAALSRYPSAKELECLPNLPTYPLAGRQPPQPTPQPPRRFLPDSSSFPFYSWCF